MSLDVRGSLKTDKSMQTKSTEKHFAHYSIPWNTTESLSSRLYPASTEHNSAKSIGKQESVLNGQLELEDNVEVRRQIKTKR